MAPNLSVPLLDLKAQHASIADEIGRAVEGVLASQWFIGGPELAALEREIAELCGAAHAVGCASGSEAILMALLAHGVGPGDEVVCPAYSFFSTAGSIARLGAVPVFADIDPETCNIDPATAASAATRCSRLKAIIPVDLYGQAADLDACLAMGDELGVPVIEDAAQAIGSRDARGIPVGSRGSIACFSFYPTKNLGGAGDGGMLTTNDPEIADRLMLLRDHGSRKRYYHEFVGLNSRLDALQAAILRVKLRHLGTWNLARQANAAHYDRVFAEAGVAVRVPRKPAAPASHVYHQYVIRVDSRVRDGLREHLRDRGVSTEIYYPVPLHLQECFRDLGYARGDLPNAEAAAEQTLALPIYPELTAEQLDHVAGATCEFLEKSVEIEVQPQADKAPAQR